jgi:F-type H+-transporting ATPase subunit g
MYSDAETDSHLSYRSMATFQTYFQPLMSAARNPSTLFSQSAATTSRLSPQTLLARLRNVSREELTSASIIGAEVLGFFTVGEMIGRMKVVGYRSSEAGAHH